MKDYYEILGLSPHASEKDVKDRYRLLSNTYHPDKFATSSSSDRAHAEEIFKLKSEAYRVLSVKESRSSYDKKWKKKWKKKFRISSVKNVSVGDLSGPVSSIKSPKKLQKMYLVTGGALAVIIVGVVITLSGRGRDTKDNLVPVSTSATLAPASNSLHGSNDAISNTEKKVASVSKDENSQNKSDKVSQKDATEIVTEQTKTYSMNGINDAIDNTEKQVASVSKNENLQNKSNKVSQKDTTEMIDEQNSRKIKVASISKNKNPQNKSDEVSQKDTTEIVTEQTKTYSVNGINDAINNTEKQVASVSKNRNPQNRSNKVSQKNTTEIVSEQTKTPSINGINDATNNTEKQVASVSKDENAHSSNSSSGRSNRQSIMRRETKQHLKSDSTEEQVASVSKNRNPQNRSNKVSQKNTTEIVTEQAKTPSINGINDATNNTEKQVASVSKDENAHSSNSSSGHSNRQSIMRRKTKQHLQSDNTEEQVAFISKNRNPQNRSNKVSQKNTTEIVTEQAKTLSINGINDAINYSRKTRMLSMQMAKLYGVQVLKNYPVDKKQKSKKDLDDAIKVVNEIYMVLLAFPQASANSEVKKSIKESQAYWYQMEKILSKESTKEVFSEVLDMSDNLLEKNNTMTKYLESLAPHAQSEFIDIAGRQRTNSMKLARDYLAASMNINKKHRMGSMLESASLFDSAMLTLKSASGNTAEIKGLIKSITKMEWRKVNQAVNQCIEDNGTKFNVLIMINFCEKLLTKTDQLTKLYVVQSSDNTKT